MDLYTQAQAYTARGWSILPVGADKKPAIEGWKQYQTTPPDDATVRKWYVEDGKAGVGVICGAVSGNLVVRDFDQAGAYEKWAAEFQGLAAQAPTVKTHRGYHVYIRTVVPAKTTKFDDGELRGEGAYVVAPPSQHPKGGRYEWVNCPNGDPPLVHDLEAAGLLGGLQHSEHSNTENTVNTETQTPHVLPVLLDNCITVLQSEGVGELIVATMPTGEGQRRTKLFELARRLKSFPALSGGEAITLRPMVRKWWEQALPTISTKAWVDTWSDFIVAWATVKVPFGEGRMDTIAKTAKPDASATAEYGDERIGKLVAVCRELQVQAGVKPFFLSHEKAAEIVGVEKTQAWRWMKMLCADGVLILTAKGHTGKASEYRYVGMRQPAPPPAPCDRADATTSTPEASTVNVALTPQEAQP